VDILSSSYYTRFFDYLTDRLDFHYSSPYFNEIKKFREHPKVVPFKKFILENGIDYGLTASGKDFGLIKFINTENILEDGTIDDTNIKFVDNCPTRLLLKKNDVLITRSRRIGFCGVITRTLENATYGSYIIRFKVDIDKLNSHFLAEVFNSRIGRLQTDLLKTGSSGENINSEQISDVRIPDIDINEQMEILDKINPLKKDIREIKKKEQDAIKERETEFRRSLGINNFQESEVSYYSAPLGLDRLDFVYSSPRYKVLEEVEAKSKFKFEEIGSHVKFHYEIINPMKTPEKTFEYIDIGNIDTKLGRIIPIEMLGKEMTSSRMRRLVKKGYVIISTTRPTRKAISIIPEELDGQVCSTGFAIAECKEELLNNYLFYFLRTNIAKLQFEKLCTGSSYPAINQEVDLPKFKIPLPKIKEQEKTIEKMQEIDSKIESFEKAIGEKEKNKNDLVESLILQKVQ